MDSFEHVKLVTTLTAAAPGNTRHMIAFNEHGAFPMKNHRDATGWEIFEEDTFDVENVFSEF